MSGRGRSLAYHTRLVPSFRDRISDPYILYKIESLKRLLRDVLATDHDLLSDAAKVAICKRILQVNPNNEKESDQ